MFLGPGGHSTAKQRKAWSFNTVSVGSGGDSSSVLVLSMPSRIPGAVHAGSRHTWPSGLQHSAHTGASSEDVGTATQQTRQSLAQGGNRTMLLSQSLRPAVAQPCQQSSLCHPVPASLTLSAEPRGKLGSIRWWLAEQKSHGGQGQRQSGRKLEVLQAGQMRKSMADYRNTHS